MKINLTVWVDEYRKVHTEAAVGAVEQTIKIDWKPEALLNEVGRLALDDYSVLYAEFTKAHADGAVSETFRIYNNRLSQGQPSGTIDGAFDQLFGEAATHRAVKEAAALRAKAAELESYAEAIRAKTNGAAVPA